jgi:hypothetical protein
MVRHFSRTVFFCESHCSGRTGGAARGNSAAPGDSVRSILFVN